MLLNYLCIVLPDKKLTNDQPNEFNDQQAIDHELTAIDHELTAQHESETNGTSTGNASKVHVAGARPRRKTRVEGSIPSVTGTSKANTSATNYSQKATKEDRKLHV